MTRAITEEEFLANPAAKLAEIGNDTFIVERDGKFVAALVSEAEFHELREKRGRKAVAALHQLNDLVEASGARERELKELEKVLDRKA